MDRISINIENQELVERLQALADEAGISIDSEIERLLEMALTFQSGNLHKAKVARQIANMSLAASLDHDSTVMLREDRDR